MTRLHPVLSVSALLVLPLVLAACGEEPAPASPAREAAAQSPEAQHCLVAVERLARNFEDVAVVRLRQWDVENVLNVAVTYDYVIPARAQGEVDEALQGLAICRYAYGLVRRNDPKRKIKALAIRFRGRPLSENELLLLDTAIAGKAPRIGFR